MAKTKQLTVTGYIQRDGKTLKREDLSEDGQKRLANALNHAGLQAAGYAPSQKVIR